MSKLLSFKGGNGPILPIVAPARLSPNRNTCTVLALYLSIVLPWLLVNKDGLFKVVSVSKITVGSIIKGSVLITSLSLSWTSSCTYDTAKKPSFIWRTISESSVPWLIWKNGSVYKLLLAFILYTFIHASIVRPIAPIAPLLSPEGKTFANPSNNSKSTSSTSVLVMVVLRTIAGKSSSGTIK